MDRFQILKGATPPPKPVLENHLKESIPVDIDIFGEEYPGRLIFLHPNQEHGLIEFTLPENTRRSLLGRKFHYHCKGRVFHINVRNETSWVTDSVLHVRIYGPID